MRGLVRRTLARSPQVGWALADQFVVSGANFLTIMMLGRLLGAEGLGIFALTWMVVLFAGSLQSALIISPMMSLGPQREPDEADGYFAAMWRGQLLFGAGCAATTLLVMWICGVAFPSIAPPGFAAPLALAVVTYQVQDFVRRYFFVRLRPRVGFMNDASSFGIQTGALLLLELIPAWEPWLNPRMVLWVVALAPVLPSLLASREIRRLIPNPRVGHRLFATQWAYSKWQVGSALLYWVSGHLMVIATGVLLGPAAVGAMTAIRRIVNVGNVMLQGIENVVPTQCTLQLLEGGVEAFRRYLRRTMVTCVGVMLAFTLMLAAVPTFWLNALAGPEFTEYTTALRLHAPYCVLGAIGLVLPAGLRAFAATRAIFLTSLVTSAASLLAARPLIMHWGIEGAIIGLLGTQTLTVVLYAFSLRRTIAAHVQEVGHGPVSGTGPARDRPVLVSS